MGGEEQGEEGSEGRQEAEGYVPSDKIILHGMQPSHFGVMENPNGQASVTGPCGDTDEFALRIASGRIQEIRFFTTGCFFTIAACDATAFLATGKTVRQAMGISRETILEYLGGLPADHEHCALLAANTLRRALRSYVVREKGL